MSEVDTLSGDNSTVYTPTTEEVRESYVLMQKCSAYPEPEAEFDRWFGDIRKQERERAINIIDKATLHYGKTHSASTVCRICEMLLAIEGEDA